MSIISPTSRPRLNEVTGVVILSGAVLVWLCLLSYQCQDASFNTAAGPARPHNLVGPAGARLADLGMQAFGFAAFVFPVLLLALAWKWIRSEPVETVWAKVAGAALFILSISALVSLAPGWRAYGGTIPAGGLTGLLLASYLVGLMNLAGTAVVCVTGLIVSVYLISTFSISKLQPAFSGPARVLAPYLERWAQWREERQRLRQEKARRKPKPVVAEPVAKPRAPGGDRAGAGA